MGAYQFTRQSRLLNAGDFNEVFQGVSVRAGNQFITVLARHTDLSFPRLGLIVGKKNIPHAVDRNRFKRLIRESFRQNQAMLGALDVIVITKRPALKLDNASFSTMLETQWRRLTRPQKTRHQISGKSAR